ncbi:LolA family protein [Muricoccus radiodurans]|uniref:LolA family protein n=1 Tax=Muricoccus radiodurans TaxID=2231721 RepID=UPI003CF3BDBF
MTARRAVLALLVLPAFPARAQDALQQVMRAFAAIRTREARFEEVKEIAGLTTSLPSSGTLRWTAPDRFEKHTTAPNEERLVVEGDRLTYQRGTIRRELSLDQSPELRPLVESIRATLAGDLATLQRHYEVAFEGTPEAWTLRLTPRLARVRAAVQRVTLSGSGGAVRRVETVGNESSVMQVTPGP